MLLGLFSAQGFNLPIHLGYLFCQLHAACDVSFNLARIGVCIERNKRRPSPFRIFNFAPEPFVVEVKHSNRLALVLLIVLNRRAGG
ncbi:hypothetical protein D3C76_1189380 [compost metagenome]